LRQAYSVCINDECYRDFAPVTMMGRSVSLSRMQQPVRERITKLREEIAEIAGANRLYLQRGKRTADAADHQRRLQRLQEILDELLSLTDWKKP
jgi:hypothetical protein